MATTKGNKVTQIKPFKLSNLRPKLYRLQLDVPEHPEVELWIDMVGSESKDYALTAAALYRNRGDATDKDVSVEQAMAESATLTASLIKGWGPEESFEKPYSPEAALELMSDYDYKWIKAQVDEAASERGNFFGN